MSSGLAKPIQLHENRQAEQFITLGYLILTIASSGVPRTKKLSATGSSASTSGALMRSTRSIKLKSKEHTPGNVAQQIQINSYNIDIV